MLTAEEKVRFLKALEEDLEFRYAVAGLLGYSEVLKRLDAIAEEQAKLAGEVAKVWSEIAKIWSEIKGLREEQARLAREQLKMREYFTRIDERLTRVERTLDKLTLDIEEEAREVLGYRLREMGIPVKLSRLELPDLEVNLYGVWEDICVIGEATVRLGKSGVEELERKVRDLERFYPNLLRAKRVLVIYASLATHDAVKMAEEKSIWILKATGDITSPPKL